MRKGIKGILWIGLCINLLMQTGCWDQKLFEKIGFILQLGIELDEEGKLLFSMTTPAVAPEVEEKAELFHISSENLVRAARERVRNVAGKLLQGGKIQHVYFSKNIANKGVNQFLDIFIRDPENPLLANVIVVDGSPKEMLELSLEYKDKPRSAFYVAELLDDARNRLNVPETRIYNFSILSYSNTIDPATPLLKYDTKNIEIAGSALFSEDKMVGEIDTDQTMLLNALMDTKGEFEYIYEGENGKEKMERVQEGAAISVRNPKRRIKIDTSGEVPVIDITLEFNSFLDEYAGLHNLDDDEKEKKLEEDIENAMKEDYLELLEYLQTIGSDPIGFGEILRSKQNMYWKSIKWKKIYKNVIFNIDIKMNLESYGIIK